MGSISPASVIAAKRDGESLDAEQIESAAHGIATAAWSDAQVGAFAMAVRLNGMDEAETVALTRAMANSGERLDWADAGLAGPCLDKHSTGGVGDKVSLMLAPMLAACGAVVPMISGRGLGHTGGTLDKLEAVPGVGTEVTLDRFRQIVRDTGCAIVAASADIAPADRRLYAVRDVTACVDSPPLITASILSKKLCAGLDALVLDVKCGSGAFMRSRRDAEALRDALVSVANGAGLRTCAQLTSMDRVLGHSAGNALEVAEAIDFLVGSEREPRLLEVTLSLGAELLTMAGLATDDTAARAMLMHSLDSGAAAARFLAMMRALGAQPGSLAEMSASLPRAPVVRAVHAARPGRVSAVDVLALGDAIVAMGGGRRHPDDAIDPAVGLVACLGQGDETDAGRPLAWIHASSGAQADLMQAPVAKAFQLSP